MKLSTSMCADGFLNIFPAWCFLQNKVVITKIGCIYISKLLNMGRFNHMELAAVCKCSTISPSYRQVSGSFKHHTCSMKILATLWKFEQRIGIS